MTDLVGGALIALSGAIAGVLVTATVTWLNTSRVNVTARENARLADTTSRENASRADGTTRALKLTDHRVAWLQKLRDEMATFLSWAVTPFEDHLTNRPLMESGTRILLLMNSADSDYAKLAGMIQRLQSAVPMSEKRMRVDEYVVTCQQILKREWEVAKSELIAGGVANVDEIRFSRLAG
ncbi:MAG: hypothetical protein ABL985_03580 [Casimicrobium sp.]